MEGNRVVTDWVDEAASSRPNKMAFVDRNRAVTYRELRDEAKTIAAFLIKKSLFKESVCVYLDKSIECIVSFMGVAYSGNYYTPLDIKMPEDRIKLIISQLDTKVVITDSKHYEFIKGIVNDISVVVYEDTVSDKSENDSLIESQRRRIVDTDVLYVMFTSGSTGTPKGVIISHKALISYIKWYIGTFGLSEETVFGNQTPLYFSMSVSDVYGNIACKGTLYLIPKFMFSFATQLVDYINDNKINTIYWVPSALSIVVNSGVLKKKRMKSIKRILFAGEVFPVSQFNNLKQYMPDIMYANLFGPTETVDICSYYIIDRELRDDETIPIGYPCSNTDLIVKDLDDEKIVRKDEINKKGELYVRGAILSYGYYGDEDKTRECFVQNPSHNFYGETVYRTGDIVHYDDLGRLIYDGRKDSQIKHMGHRIELGEIEVAVGTCKDIEKCAALYDDEKKIICLFYVGDIKEADVKNILKNKILKYMMPKYIKNLAEMPVNANGKIDRVALKREYLS